MIVIGKSTVPDVTELNETGLNKTDTTLTDKQTSGLVARLFGKWPDPASPYKRRPGARTGWEHRVVVISTTCKICRNSSSHRQHIEFTGLTTCGTGIDLYPSAVWKTT
jgi:hypothetical protein